MTELGSKIIERRDCLFRPGKLIVMLLLSILTCGQAWANKSVTITESGGSTNVSEAGPTSDTYTVVLDQSPTNPVTITITPDSQVNLGAGAGVAITLAFNNGNWNIAQTVTVTAVDDQVAQGSRTSIIRHSASSNDANYNSIALNDVTAYITDNDIAGVTVTESGGSTDVNEAGPTSDTYTVALNTQPMANVTLTVAADGYTTVSPATLTFTPANWNTPQTVTVTAVDDSVVQGTHISTITHVAASLDPIYSGLAVRNVIAHVTDNDAGSTTGSAGVTIVESGGSTSINEQGPTSDSYTVVLNTQPAATVTITVGPDGFATVSPATLTFTTANWNTPQTVTVTAVDDAIAQGPHTSTIRHTAASTDSYYNGLVIRDIVAGVTDNDAAGVTIAESGGSTDVNEQGATSDTYTVVLNTQPTAGVTINVAADGYTSVSPASLTFTTANWNTPQTVTVTAVDDALPQGKHTSTITHSTASTDPVYSGMAIRSVYAHVTDNDIAGITITESGGSTAVAEGGATDSYTVALNTPPTANVTVAVTPDAQLNLGAGAGTPITLTFTTANWSTAQTVTVTAVDDQIARGLHYVNIAHTLASTDVAYDGLAARGVTVQITDNDIAGVTITETGGSTDVNEQGTTSDTYTVVLNTCPTANVTIAVASDGRTSTAPASLTFTPGNWNTTQTVTVTAIDDTAAQGPYTSTISHSASSTDPGYNAIAIRQVTAHVTDNDAAGVTITESGGSTSVTEGGATDSYTVVLNTQPTASVTVTVTPDAQINLGGGAGTPVTLTFTTANWNAAQTVTVTAVNDSVAQGLRSAAIRHSAASTDPIYSGIAIRDVVVQITDNDTAGVTITESGGSTDVSEQGTTSDTYTVVLNTQPTATVTVAVTGDGQATVAPATLTFTTANWNTPQTVMVTAIDDTLAEGNHTSTIAHSAASTDPNYSGIAIRSVAAHITDNDIAGVTITESGGSTDVNEQGATSDTYTVVLNTAPQSTVTISVASDGRTAIAPGTLTFTTANWNVPQTVTVTAIDDMVAQGYYASTITHTASSADPSYSLAVIRPVVVHVSDNDAAGVTITESGGSTSVTEGGATDSYTVVLNTQPTASVTVTVTPDAQINLGGGAGTPVTLTFTTANWNAAQTVTVTAVADNAALGPHSAAIIHAASSTDPNYSGIAIRPVTVQVTDADIAGITLTESGGSTDVNETGPTSDTYTLVLNTRPSGNVTITVTPDVMTTVGTGPGTVKTLTFTPADWNTPQTVTVTAIDDAEAQGPHTSVIVHSVASTDPHYNGYYLRNVIAHITDNDLAGVTITESGGSTDVNEQGPTSDTYTVVLNTPPTANVTVTAVPDGQVSLGAGASVPVTLTFTPANWNSPQTLTVTAIDDTVAEGYHCSTISHATDSTDPNYSGVTVRSIIAHITDNDAPGLTISESGGSTDVGEQGPTSDTYTLVLNTQPTANVTIAVVSDGQTTAAPTTLTFTIANWNVPQTVTVTATDDAVPEGPHTSTISHTASSTDPNYASAAIRNVTAHITDNDMVGITITESGGATIVNEQGPTSASYTVVLNTQPTGNVTITVTTDTQLTASPTTLTFTTANWNTPQTVTVTAVDDAVAQGQRCSTVTHTAASGDPNYNALAVQSVVVQVFDNDAAGVTITESGGSTDVNEQGPTSDSYTVVLNTRPTDTVTISVAADGQTAVSPATLTFTPATWNTPQSVTVTAVDDDVAEAAHSSAITHTAASTDANYNNISIRNVTAHVTDNDALGVTITESAGSTDVSEQGPTSDNYTVVLNTRPSADVTITVTPDAQTTVSPASLTFTPANWNVPQTVAVTAVDDPYAEGAHFGTIAHAAFSTDKDYSGIAIRNVTAHIADNDMAGITIVESGGSTDVAEQSPTGPTLDTYAVVLDAPPNSADVVITIDPDSQVDLGAGAGNSRTLTFTTANWNVPQTVTVTAVDDHIPKGLHTSTITHTAASTDPHYNRIVIRNVAVNVSDMDQAAVVITESDGMTQVSEQGSTSDTYTVVLSITPTSNVTITVAPDNLTDVGAGPGQPVNLLFTTANWNVPQTVTVTAIDDGVARGLHTSTITHKAASSDPNYNGIAVRSVTVTIIDNSAAGISIVESGGHTEVSEAGPTSDSYTVVLDTVPTADVTIEIDPDEQTNVGNGPGVPRFLQFGSANWNIPQAVTVTAVPDHIARGLHQSVITHVARSSDHSYNGIAIKDVVVTIIDADIPGVTIGESGGSTDISEAGPTTDRYTLVLNTIPTADVSIVVDPDAYTDVGAGPEKPITLSFTKDNWNVPQTVTVTAVDDLVAEGLHTSTISHTVVSADLIYNGINVRNVLANVTDNDVAGLTIVQTNGSTEVNEKGHTADSYTVVLNTRPVGDVVILADPDNQVTLGEGAGVPKTLTFTPDNWNIPQTITVTAVPDGIAEGDHASTITHILSSTDRNYNGINRTVTATVRDCDVAGITVTESGGSTAVDELGPTSDNYTVVLNSPPAADVIVTAAVDGQLNLGQGPGAPARLTFTPDNWNVPQTVTVTAVDDSFAQGRHYSVVRHTTASADPIYNGLTVHDISVTISDNDAKGVSIIESGGSTDVDEQQQTTDTYQVVLNTSVTSNVQITAIPGGPLDLGKGSGQPLTLTFTPANWNVPQTVTIHAVDDKVAQGPYDVIISHTCYSLDGSYSSAEVDPVTVHVADGEAPAGSGGHSASVTGIAPCSFGGIALIAAAVTLMMNLTLCGSPRKD